jgi:hypothetical protein
MRNQYFSTIDRYGLRLQTRIVSEYQIRKAKVITRILLGCQAQSTLTRHQLARCVAIMPNEDWQTVAFQAGVPVADIPAKAAVLAMLRGRVIHVL